MEANIYNKISKIKVEKLRLRAHIGFNDWEKEKLQDIVISFSFKYNMLEAVKNDDVSFGINYKSITKSIIKLIDNKQFHLIETVAEKVFETIKKNPEVLDVKVMVEKPNALRFCDNVLVEISDLDRSNIALIAIGSNINPEKNVKSALLELRKIGTILKETKFIFTEPLKFTEQPNFLNGAILLDTKLYYNDLNVKLKKIEIELGRKKTENKNAPRTIDLDIVAFNSTITDNEIKKFPFLIEFINQLQPELEIN